jgi:hypothetical protein
VSTPSGRCLPCCSVEPTGTIRAERLARHRSTASGVSSFSLQGVVGLIILRIIRG